MITRYSRLWRDRTPLGSRKNIDEVRISHRPGRADGDDPKTNFVEQTKPRLRSAPSARLTGLVRTIQTTPGQKKSRRYRNKQWAGRGLWPPGRDARADSGIAPSQRAEVPPESWGMDNPLVNEIAALGAPSKVCAAREGRAQGARRDRPATTSTPFRPLPATTS